MADEEPLFAINGNGWTIAKNNRFRMQLDAYSGGGGFATGAYYVPHVREFDDKFNSRKAKGRVINDFKPIINGHVAPIFRGDPQRTIAESVKEVDSDAYEMFLDDVDGQGTSYKKFMKQAARAAKKLDSAFVYIERNQSGTKLESDLKDRNNLPFLRLITPDQIENDSNIAITPMGDIEFIRFRTTVSVVGEKKKRQRGGKSGTVKFSKKRDIWTSIDNEFFTFEDPAGGEIEPVPNKLGFVPVIAIYPDDNDNPSDTPLPYGMGFSLASTQVRINNVASIIDDIVDNQAFSVFISPITIEGLDLGTDGSVQGYAQGGETTLEPKFIAPDPSQLKTLIEERESQKTEMYRVSAMIHMQNFAQSGDSRKEEKERTHEQLADFRSQIQDADKKIIGVFGDYLNVDFGYNVSYTQDFGLSGVDTLFTAYEKFTASEPLAPPKLISEVVKSLSGVLLTNQNEEQAELLLTDIDTYYTGFEKLAEKVLEQRSKEENKQPSAAGQARPNNKEDK